MVLGEGRAADAAALTAEQTEQAGVAPSPLLTEQGTIESLDVRQKAFRLRVGSGRSSRTIRVRTVLSTPLKAAGRVISWDNLREGQQVTVRWYDTTGRRARSNQRIFPTEIELLTQELTGRIDGVNAGSEMVRATLGELEEVTEARGGKAITRTALKENEEGRARRQTTRFGALPALQVMREGQPVTLRDVRDGDFFRAQVVEVGAKLLLLKLELNPMLSKAEETGAGGAATAAAGAVRTAAPSLEKRRARPTARVTVRRAR